MNTGLTTQEQIALAKEILQVKNRRERSLKGLSRNGSYNLGS